MGVHRALVAAPAQDQRQTCIYKIRRVDSYKHRGAVERFFAWLLNFKRIVIRHERLVRVYQAFINLASILILWGILK